MNDVSQSIQESRHRPRANDRTMSSSAKALLVVTLGSGGGRGEGVVMGNGGYEPGGRGPRPPEN